MDCNICGRPDRADIEAALVANEPVDSVAESFGVDPADLKQHVVMCPPVSDLVEPSTDLEAAQAEPSATDPQTQTQPTSIARKLKLQEADMLAEAADDYMQTLKAMGLRLRKLSATDDLNDPDEMDFRCAKLLTKPMVDLYVGAGGEVRQTVRTMAELDKLLNGESDTSSAGLNALAAAIVGSRQLAAQGWNPTSESAGDE